MLQGNNDALANNLSLSLDSMGLSGSTELTCQQNAWQIIPAIDVDDLHITMKYPQVGEVISW